MKVRIHFFMQKVATVYPANEGAKIVDPRYQSSKLISARCTVRLGALSHRYMQTYELNAISRLIREYH